jgi:bla regulator protein blaR1
MIVANHLWQSTVCAGIVWLLALALKKNRAAIRYWLWLAASVKFLIPFSLLVSVGNQVHWRTAPPIARAQWSGFIDYASPPFAIVAPVSQAVTLSVFLTGLLIALWFCGFAVSIVFWIRCWLRLRAARRCALPLALDVSIPVMSSPVPLAPGVFGISKPVPLLPEGIGNHLTPAQWKLIVAHELCHVQRRDNLTGAIHMLVEAVFWFYPLVWWIRARLIDERERACDEAVCSQGHDTEVYAEGILKVCEFHLESTPIWASGITAVGLKRRVESIMAGSIVDRMNFGKKLMLVIAGSAALFAPVAFGILNAPPVRAQSSALSPRFEAASIKPSKDPRYTGIVMHAGGYLTANGPLSILIEEAYGVKRNRIVGAPAWIDSSQYLLEAKADSNLKEEQMSRALQGLLEDRFEMKVRREPKEIQIYALTMAGNRIHEPPRAPGPPAGQIRAAVYPGFGWLQGRGVSTELLANRLSLFLDRPLVDQTGFRGQLDVDLQFALDRGVRLPNGQAISASAGSHRPSIFAAVEEQLGMRIESAKDTVTTLVIDHIGWPLPN